MTNYCESCYKRKTSRVFTDENWEMYLCQPCVKSMRASGEFEPITEIKP